jgi:tetratricopeptide (TPR) repeat protein
MPTFQEAQLRHAVHYANVLSGVNHLYLEVGRSSESGPAGFRLELSNIKIGMKWAKENAGDNDAAAFLCAFYPTVGADLLDIYQHPEERISWLKSAQAVLPRFPNQFSESGVLNLMGRAYAALGRMQDAINSHKQGLVKAREAGDRHGEGIAISNLGVAYFYLGDTSSAIECQEQAIAISLELGNKHAEAQAKGDLGNVYYLLRDYHRAIELYEQRLAIAREIKDKRNEEGALMSLGLGYAALGRTKYAIDFYEQALALARGIYNIRAEGEILANLSTAYAVLGENERALEISERRLEIAREIGDRRGEGSTLFNKGFIHRELGDNDKAIAHAEAALDILEEMGDPYVERMRVQLNEWYTGPKKAIPPIAPQEDSRAKRMSVLNDDYQARVRSWKSLPWWRRLVSIKPSFPSELQELIEESIKSSSADR